MMTELSVSKSGTNKSSSGRRGRPPASEARSRAETRVHLLQAASDVMIAKDSADVSLSEIAEKTGLSAALVQYHFGSKEGLLIALLERDSAKAIAQLHDLAKEALPATTKLRLHIGGLVNAYFRAPYLNRLLHHLMLKEEAETAQRLSDLFVRPIAEFQSALIEQGLREGVFRPVPPFEFYFMVVGACDHLFARRVALRDVFGLDVITEDMKRNYARTITAMVLNGITTR